jgi:hypothetical protein
VRRVTEASCDKPHSPITSRDFATKSMGTTPMPTLLTHAFTFVVFLAAVPFVWAMLESRFQPRSN